jgi:hypothetical protein
MSNLLETGVSSPANDQNLLSRALPCFGRHVKSLSQLILQSLAPTNPHWAHMVGYGLFSLCVIHKEGPYLSSVDIKRLMMMMWSHRLCINRPTKRGKEKSPSDDCQCQKEMDDHLLACQQFYSPCQ